MKKNNKVSYYKYKGRKNKTSFPEFVALCKLTQEKLIEILPDKLLDAGYNDVVKGDGYIYAKGEIPYLLTAHMDTVHKNPVNTFYEYIDEKKQHIISSPQGIGGDDRCGIYMILEIIKEFKPSILFCEDEEQGGVGSSKFCKTDLIQELSGLNYLIELDRANGTDAVFYDCDNPEFTDFIEKATGYKEAFGSFSDISELCPACKVAGVNLSCGYYHAHTLQEEVNVEEMLHTIEVVKKLLTTECEQFEYIEAKHYYNNWRNYNYGYDYYEDYYDDYGYYGKSKDKTYQSGDSYDYDWVCLWVEFENKITKKIEETQYHAKSEEEAWGLFFLAHQDISYNDVLDYYFDYL